MDFIIPRSVQRARTLYLGLPKAVKNPIELENNKIGKIPLKNKYIKINIENTQKNLINSEINKKNIQKTIANNYNILIDTGSGVNITNNKNCLSDYTKLNDPPKFYGICDTNNPIKIHDAGYLPIKINDTYFVCMSSHII